MQIAGFFTLKKDADFSKAMGSPKDWDGFNVALEINDDGDILALDRKGVNMSMFDKRDIESSFRCIYTGGVLIPPYLNTMQQMHYSTLVQTRKGGYNKTIEQMIIIASLHKRELCDSMLWQLQDEDTKSFVNTLKQLNAKYKLRNDMLVEAGMHSINRNSMWHEITNMQDHEFDALYARTKAETEKRRKESQSKTHVILKDKNGNTL